METVESEYEKFYNQTNSNDCEIDRLYELLKIPTIQKLVLCQLDEWYIITPEDKNLYSEEKFTKIVELASQPPQTVNHHLICKIVVQFLKHLPSISQNDVQSVLFPLTIAVESFTSSAFLMSYCQLLIILITHYPQLKFQETIHWKIINCLTGIFHRMSEDNRELAIVIDTLLLVMNQLPYPAQGFHRFVEMETFPNSKLVYWIENTKQYAVLTSLLVMVGEAFYNRFVHGFQTHILTNVMYVRCLRELRSFDLLPTPLFIAICVVLKFICDTSDIAVKELLEALSNRCTKYLVADEQFVLLGFLRHLISEGVSSFPIFKSMMMILLYSAHPSDELSILLSDYPLEFLLTQEEIDTWRKNSSMGHFLRTREKSLLHGQKEGKSS